MKNAKKLLDYYEQLSDLGDMERSQVSEWEENLKNDPDFNKWEADGFSEWRKINNEPDKIENYMIVRNKNENRSDDWLLIAMDINGNTSVSSELSEQDIKDIDVIVVAESNLYSSKYQFNGSNSGNNVSISAEMVTVYFFNTKTKTIFDTDFYSESLPEKTRKTATREISDEEIIEKAKEKMGVQ